MRSRAAWSGAVVAIVGYALAAVQVPHGTAADEPAGPKAADFQPGDISIGEPIALPFAGSADPTAPAADRPVPATAPRAIDTPPDLPPVKPAGPLDAARRTGWLGMALVESATPGRWSVAEVAPGGPAAGAGIMAGDEVRAIDGRPLRNADEVAEALTAIAVGQEVRLATARAEQPSEVTLVATARPDSVLARARQASAEAEVAAVPPATPPTSPLPPVTALAPAAAVPASPATPPAASIPPVTTPPSALVPAEPSPAHAWAATPPSFTPPAALAEQPGRLAAEPAPGPSLPSASPSARGRTALGVRTIPVDPGVRERFRLPADSGAYVIGVVQDLPASRAGVPPGSVIVSLANQPVRSPDELTRLVTAGPVGRPVSIEYVLPGGTPRKADVVLQSLERPLEEALLGPTPAATAPPALTPGPAATMAERPLADSADLTAVRAEVEWLRARLAALERRLEATSSGRGDR